MCTPRALKKWCKKRIVNCWLGCFIPGCSWGGCCKCPHGACYTVMAILGGFGGCWMNMYVVMSCKFQRITELNPITGEAMEHTRLGYGLLAREIMYEDTAEDESYQGCRLYPAEEEDFLVDGWFKIARFCAFLGGLLGLICWIVLIMSYCFRFTPPTFERWILWCYIYAALCMAFTMLLYGNHFCKDNKCKVANGTGYAISCLFTYLMLANTVKAMGQPPPKDDMPQPGGREDDLWYDREEDRYHSDSSGDEYESEDEFEDEFQENERRQRGQEGRFQNSPDQQQQEFDDMHEYMAPEDRYAKPKDRDFMDRDQQQQQEQADNVQELPYERDSAPPQRGLHRQPDQGGSSRRGMLA